jgi:filamentous hemagglutinin
MDGKETAIEAKFTRRWARSPRNPSGRIGNMHFSAKAQREMIDQAQKYEASYPGGVIYHTNSIEFARFYTMLFHEMGIWHFHFIITPSR